MNSTQEHFPIREFVLQAEPAGDIPDVVGLEEEAKRDFTSNQPGTLDSDDVSQVG
jgi:hypothetical protein